MLARPWRSDAQRARSRADVGDVGATYVSQGTLGPPTFLGRTLGPPTFLGRTLGPPPPLPAEPATPMRRRNSEAPADSVYSQASLRRVRSLGSEASRAHHAGDRPQGVR